MFTIEITKPELLARLEEVRQAGSYSDFQQVVELLVTKASALDAIAADADLRAVPASAGVLLDEPGKRTPVDRFVAADADAAREIATSRGHADTTSIEETDRTDPGGAWREFEVFAPEPSGE